jgi:hypothetical protein
MEQVQRLLKLQRAVVDPLVGQEQDKGLFVRS